MIRYAGSSFAQFPLTLTLSLREREQRASRSTKLTGPDCSPQREGFTLFPGERAGKETIAPRGANAFALACVDYPKDNNDFESFMISSLRLCRKSLTPIPGRGVYVSGNRGR